MAASDHHPRLQPPDAGDPACLPEAAMRARLEEEIDRARRFDAPLSCLLVRIDDLKETSGGDGGEVPVQTLAYVGEALRTELRSFDRIGRLSDSELLITIPGADGARAETVGRRVLERLQLIKVESGGRRRPLGLSVGLASWNSKLSGEELLTRARAAVGLGPGNGGPLGLAGPGAPSPAPGRR